MFSLRSMPQRRWAHPRERGEHFSEADANRPCAGSSPRARGAWLELEGWGRSPGLIPASVGSIALTTTGQATAGAHPRERGEHLPNRLFPGRFVGSSPRARGAS